MIKLVCVGKIKDKNLKSLVDDYLVKINHYHKTEIIEVNDVPIVDDEKTVLDKEANNVLKHIKDKDYVILLDLHGNQSDSVKFASHLDKLFISNSNITFVIGGSLGVGKALIERSNERLSLSQMTFLHQMTRLILLEQIYRCFKINNNETYHK